MTSASITTEFDYAAALRACALQERDALAALYHHESARLVGVARRIVGDTALAEDIVHDGFVKIWHRAATFDAARGSARGWIHSIVRNLALNHIRDHGRMVSVDADTEEQLASAAAMQVWRQTQASAAWQDDAARLVPCLEILPPERRECILQAYVNGLSHAEIAVRLTTPLGTVKAWLKRSLQALRECME